MKTPVATPWVRFSCSCLAFFSLRVDIYVQPSSAPLQQVRVLLVSFVLYLISRLLLFILYQVPGMFFVVGCFIGQRFCFALVPGTMTFDLPTLGQTIMVWENRKQNTFSPCVVWHTRVWPLLHSLSGQRNIRAFRIQHLIAATSPRLTEDGLWPSLEVYAPLSAESSLPCFEGHRRSVWRSRLGRGGLTQFCLNLLR